MARLGYDRARADIPQHPFLSLLSGMEFEMCEDGGKSFMARRNEPEQEPEQEPGRTQGLVPFETGSVLLVSHVGDWKDIVGEIDWLNLSPAGLVMECSHQGQIDAVEKACKYWTIPWMR